MKFLEAFPPSLRLAFYAAVGLMAFVTWDQIHWWQIKEDYRFGFLVPLFVAYVMYERWPKITKLVGEGLPGPSSAALDGASRFLAWAGLAMGGLLLLFGALLRANQPQPPASFAIAVSASVMILAIIYLQIPRASPVPGVSHGLFSPRLKFTLIFLFPALVWVLSARCWASWKPRSRCSC
jgi:hypothetical protein